MQYLLLRAWDLKVGVHRVHSHPAPAPGPLQVHLVPGAVVHPALGGPDLDRAGPEVQVQVQVAVNKLKPEKVTALGKVWTNIRVMMPLVKGQN